MKIFRSISLYVVTVSLLIAGCKEDILRTTPQNLISDDAVFKDLAFAKAFLNETYDGVPSGFERGFYSLDAATDEAETGYPWAYSQNWNQGDFSPTNPPRFSAPWDNSPTQWERGYNFIRRTNTFLGQIDGIPGDEAEKKVLKGEARFLRALFYHELVKLYGGVPLIDKAQTLENPEALLVARNTFDECVDFIVADLDEAAQLLPDQRTGKDVGRASKAAALALKGRQLLYAERWDKSAAASLATRQLSGYSLFPNYEEMFWAANNNNSEVLFARQYLSKAENRVHPFNQFNSVPTHSGWGGTQPTQNLVDKYEMIDGLSYDTSPLYDPAHPYAKRDPRFEATILHDASVWIGDTLELFENAFQGVHGSSNDATKTGYYLRKFMDPAIITVDNNNGYNNWPVIRLAEVLLNYAEAQNEAVGPDAMVYEAVNAIRSQPSVSMPPLPAGLTKDQMREKIRQERTIELAFEEHRFFDLRRWKDANGKYLADKVLAEPVYGMLVSSDRSTYTRFKKEDRVYEPKHRLLPIAQSEIVKYGGKLQQNPGW